MLLKIEIEKGRIASLIKYELASRSIPLFLKKNNSEKRRPAILKIENLHPSPFIWDSVKKKKAWSASAFFFAGF